MPSRVTRLTPAPAARRCALSATTRRNRLFGQGIGKHEADDGRHDVGGDQEMHLSNAYRKLGIASRTRLADVLAAEAEP